MISIIDTNKDIQTITDKLNIEPTLSKLNDKKSVSVENSWVPNELVSMRKTGNKDILYNRAIHYTQLFRPIRYYSDFLFAHCRSA